MSQIFGAGTPRGIQGRALELLLITLGLYRWKIRALVRRITTLGRNPYSLWFPATVDSR